MEPKLITVKQFCIETGFSSTTVYRQTQKGIIPTVRIGGSVRIPAWYLDGLTREPGKLPGYLTREEGSQFRLSDLNRAATQIEVTNGRRRPKAAPQHLEVFTRGSSSVGISPVSDKYTEAGILNECAALRLVREGSRNDSLNTAAFKCGQLVAQNPSYLKFAVDTLVGVARSIGLDETEYRRTIGSGISSGIQSPRGSR